MHRHTRVHAHLNTHVPKHSHTLTPPHTIVPAGAHPRSPTVSWPRRVARVDSCTAPWTHSLHTVSRGAPPAIHACVRRKGGTMAWPNRFQPVAHHAPPTLPARCSRSCGERMAPLRGLTGFSLSHTMHPPPFQRIPLGSTGRLAQERDGTGIRARQTMVSATA
jgi:hypothetical protein